GTNPSVSAAAAGSIVWVNPNTPPTPANLTYSAQNGILHASWDAVTAPGGATIQYYNLTVLDSQGAFVKAVPVSGTQWDLTSLTPGTYKLEVSAVLASGLASPPSSPVTAALPAPSFPGLS